MTFASPSCLIDIEKPLTNLPIPTLPECPALLPTILGAARMSFLSTPPCIVAGNSAKASKFALDEIQTQNVVPERTLDYVPSPAQPHGLPGSTLPPRAATKTPSTCRSHCLQRWPPAHPARPLGHQLASELSAGKSSLNHPLKSPSSPHSNSPAWCQCGCEGRQPPAHPEPSLHHGWAFTVESQPPQSPAQRRLLIQMKRFSWVLICGITDSL